MSEEKEAYRFLLQPRRKLQEIKRLEETVSELRSCLLPSAVRYDKDQVQTSPENAQEATIVKIVEMENRLQILKDERAKAIISVNDAIEGLKDRQERYVMTARYIKGMWFQDIAALGYMSESSVYRAHRRGIAKIAENLKIDSP